MKKRCPDVAVDVASDEGKRRRCVEDDHMSSYSKGRGGGRIPDQEPLSPIDVKFSRKAQKNKSYSGFTITKSNYNYMLANIIPVEESKLITEDIIKEIYELEREVSQFNSNEISKIEYQNGSLNIRLSILTWMSQCAAALEWSIPSVQAAIGTYDLYCSTAKHYIKVDDLGRIAATCLYYAGHMQETAVDDTIKSLEKLSSLCTEVGSPSVFLGHEIHLVDTLQGMNFSKKTPFDFLMLYLARIQHSTGIFGEVLFEHLLKDNSLGIVMDTMHISTVYYYLTGLSIYIPGSLWVAVGLLNIFVEEIDTISFLRDIGFEQATLSKYTTSEIYNIKVNILYEIILVTTVIVEKNIENNTADIENILPTTYNIDVPCSDYITIKNASQKLYSILRQTIKSSPNKRDMSHRLLNPILYRKAQLSYKPAHPYMIPIQNDANVPDVTVKLTRPHSCWVYKHPPPFDTETDDLVKLELNKLKSIMKSRLQSDIKREQEVNESNNSHRKRGSMSNGFVLPKPRRAVSCAPMRHQNAN